MPNIFLEFVRLSLIGSLFAGAVMLVRLVFRKAPKWLICVLWGIVALRLICPISIESNFSLVPGRIANGEILTDIGSAYIGEVDRIYENDAEYHDAIESGGQPVYSNDGYYIVTEKDSFEVPKTVGMAVYPVFSWIWASGVIAMLAYTAVSYLILKKKMAEATLLRDNIWQCNQAESPFVLGIIKPQIYIPYWITDSDLANVIAHEQAHIERKDHWWKPVGFLLLSLYWFNPVLWIAYVMLCRDIEAACDEKVIRHMEKEEIRVYSTALLNCSIHRRRIAACPLAFGEEGVKERIKRIMCYKKPTFWMITAAVAACIAVAVCFMTSPEKPRNQPPEIPEESLEAGPVEIIGTKTYYQNPDGTWQANGQNYKYRLEISGTMPNAAAKSTFVYLSNIENITFTQAWKAAGFSSNTEDYFPAEEAVLVDWSTEESASGTQTGGTDPLK